MSAAKSIDVRSCFSTLFVIYIAASVPGCSPREMVQPIGKTENSAAAHTDADAKPVQEASQPHIDGKSPSRPSDIIPPVPSEVATQQHPPTNALELREEAKQLAEELVQRFPSNPDALEIKARFLMLFGETEEAKKCWLAAVNIDPNYAYALHGLAKVAMLNSDSEQAIVYLSIAIRDSDTSTISVWR